jgi:hypothetical protein
VSTVVTVTQPTRSAWVATWASLANGETGVAADIPLDAATRSIQVSGTFGAAGAVAIEGSNDGINWAPLSNSFVATPLSVTAAGISDILQNTRFVRPRSTAGDGTTALKIVLAAV